MTKKKTETKKKITKKKATKKTAKKKSKTTKKISPKKPRPSERGQGKSKGARITPTPQQDLETQRLEDQFKELREPISKSQSMDLTEREIEINQGRPSICTPHLIEQICNYIRGGVPKTVACSLVGISCRLWYAWEKQGNLLLDPTVPQEKKEKIRSIYGQFVQKTDEAVASFEGRMAMYVSAAAKEKWGAAAWMLKSRFPERWNQSIVKHEGTVDNNHNHSGDLNVDMTIKEELDLRQKILSDPELRKAALTITNKLKKEDEKK